MPSPAENSTSAIKKPQEGGDGDKTSSAVARHHDQNSLSRAVSQIDDADATSRYNVEAQDNKLPSGPPPNSCSSGTAPAGRRVISWAENDPENPYNWSSARKSFIVIALVTTVLNSTFGSSLPSNAIPFIMEDYGVADRAQAVLPISVFLIGYVFGPLFFGPLSEQYGRQRIVIATFLFYIIFTLACALAPSWTAFLFFRLLCGVSASAPIAIVGGVYADIYDDPSARGLAMAIFMTATSMGPLFAPIVSGFVSPALGWRWTFWIGLIIAGACLPPLLFIPETFAPVLLTRRAKRLRKSTGDIHIFAPQELEKQGFKQLATVTLTRPVRMLFFELIVASTCLYLAIAYAIFYMYFQAYPIIFQGIYHFSPGVAGLMFLPIGLGEIIALPIFIYYDYYHKRAQARSKPWALKEESRRVPLAFVGGPLYVIALFWLGFSARNSIHWSAPMLAGVAFGLGFELIFMALINYLTDAYEIFAASAMAASSCTRSVMGAILPLATSTMYERLGVAGASSLLGGVSAGMCVLPWVFVHWGPEIRARSRFCRYLKEKKDQEMEEREKDRRREMKKEQVGGREDKEVV